MLPQAARTSLEYNSGDVSESVVEYTHCRQFQSASMISFDKEVDVSASPAKKEEAIELPGGLTVAVRLENAIDLRRAHAGDETSAHVASDVTSKRKTWLPAGAMVRGRIRRLEKIKDPRESVLLGLEFTEFAGKNGHGVFFADFQSSNIGTSVSDRLPFRSIQTEFLSLLAGGILETTSIEEFSNLELPGVAVLELPKKTGELPAGTELVWRTKKLGRR